MARAKTGNLWWRRSIAPLPFKALAVIEQKPEWLSLQLSRLRLIGRRIALTIVFFCLKETIRFLD
jgi:hypothetical protein